jgi:putative phosphoesterase
MFTGKSIKIGLVSDSHGNLDNLRRAAEILVNQKVDLIIHLGDDYDDAKILESLGIEIIKIPGVFSDYYKNSKIPNRLIKQFGNFRVLLTHTLASHENDLPGDLKPEELIEKKKIEAIFYGHTHIPRIHQEKGILCINPGHLKKEDKKGYPASFALLDIGEKIKAKILTLNGKEIARINF